MNYIIRPLITQHIENLEASGGTCRPVGNRSTMTTTSAGVRAGDVTEQQAAVEPQGITTPINQRIEYPLDPERKSPRPLKY